MEAPLPPSLENVVKQFRQDLAKSVAQMMPGDTLQVSYSLDIGNNKGKGQEAVRAYGMTFVLPRGNQADGK